MSPAGSAIGASSPGHFPRTLAAVDPRYREPHHAELAAGAVVIVVVLVADVRSAIGLSSFAVLAYYAVANASALTVRQSTGSVIVPSVGLVGCVALAASLPVSSTAAGTCVLAVGAVIRWLRRGA